MSLDLQVSWQSQESRDLHLNLSVSSEEDLTALDCVGKGSSQIAENPQACSHDFTYRQAVWEGSWVEQTYPRRSPT